MARRHLFSVAGAVAGAAAAMAAVSTGTSSGKPGDDNVVSVVRTGPAPPASRSAIAPISSEARATSLVAADAAPIRHDIAVNIVDPAAVQQPNAHTNVPNKHLVLVPSDPAQRKGRLMLFVSGTNSSETLTQEIVKAGARRGYHAIAIAYPNYDAVGMLCLASLDDECSAKVREEVLTGVDLTPLVTVGSANGLEPRLRKLLAYLAATYPDEGWGAFLAAGDVNWPSISLVGHSQGAGHVAYMAKRHLFLRSLMISGVADITALGQPAPWLFRPNVTPVARQYGFTHLADYVVALPIALASWHAIGLQTFGPVHGTDGQQPGYGGSHMLTTALLPRSGVNPHVSMLEDASMPREADGTPSFRPVWDYGALP